MNNYENQIPWKDWKIVRRLGGGGFGTVYEIERDFFGEEELAAMKVIRIPKEESDLDDDYNSGMTEEEVREKYTYIQNYFSKEYQLMLEFKGHSNIVNCHDFSVVPNPDGPGCALYIRMELLKPLKEVLKTETFSEARIVQLGIDICRALEICERRDVIHRDIKPDNIMMSDFGNFKLGDFGIARTMEKTMSASMAGTDWYMAPEVAKKMKYGKSVDTYSLGLVLYWLLNDGRLPFVPEKDRISTKDMQAAYRLRMQGKEIPEPKRGSRQLKAVVLKALSFEREKRYRSGKEMLEALLEIEKLTKAENARAQKVQTQKKQTQNVQAQNGQDQKTQGQESLTGRVAAQRQKTQGQESLAGRAAAQGQKKAQAQNISQEQEMQRGPQPENQITAEENAWRIAYAENLLRQSEWYRQSEFSVMPDSVLGIYLDTDMIHVRIWMDEKSRPVLSMPAYYILDDLGEVLVGSRALVHAKMNQKKNIHSVLAFMQESDRLVDSTLEPCGIRYCIDLMKELRRELEKTAVAQVRDCVVTISVPEIVTQKNVRTAMEKAGFQVMRCTSVVEACAFSKAQLMNYDQQFLVRVIANHERQNLKIEYSDKVLDGLEYTFGEKCPKMPDKACYDLSDEKSRRELGREAVEYEELSVVAADGAAAQGATFRGRASKHILLLVISPWKLGIEIETIRGGQECFPLTWFIDEQYTIPIRTKCFDISLDSGIVGKRLNLYQENAGSRRRIRTWKMEEVCPELPKDASQLAAQIEADWECGAVRVILKAGEKSAEINLNRYHEEKLNRCSDVTTFVPESIVESVLRAGNEFCRGAEHLDDAKTDLALGKGIRMIAGQTEEVFADCQRGNTSIRVSTLIEKMLTVKDNIEYGIASAERTTKRMEYMKEKLLLIDFRNALERSLYQLNVVPVEANGAVFDPYIHEAVHIEETNLVEENRVVSVVQKGYFFGEKLYRPARVVVSKEPVSGEVCEDEGWDSYDGETIGGR